MSDVKITLWDEPGEDMNRSWEYKIADGARAMLPVCVMPVPLEVIEFQMEFDVEGLQEFLKQVGIDPDSL